MNIFKAFTEFLRAPFLCHLDLGGGGSAPPPPDPNIGLAAQQNAAVAAEALAFNRQVYNDNRPRQAAADALATQVVQDQLAISQQNQARAAEQWNRFQTLFAPVEDRTVAEAMNIDSAAELARASGDAASGVQMHYDSAGRQRARAQAAMGINPNSGRAMAMDSESQLGLAASKAGAANNARLVARDRGIAMRAGVANFGRNMPNTAANAYGLAVNSGNSAMNNQGSLMAMANANAGQMNQGFGVGIQGNHAAGNLLLGQYNGQLGAWNAQQQADAQRSAGMGNMIGTIGAFAF